MNISETNLHFTPYLFELASESRAWVFSAGQVTTYGLPMRDLLEPLPRSDENPVFVPAEEHEVGVPLEVLRGLERRS